MGETVGRSVRVGEGGIAVAMVVGTGDKVGIGATVANRVAVTIDVDVGAMSSLVPAIAQRHNEANAATAIKSQMYLGVTRRVAGPDEWGVAAAARVPAYVAG